MEQMGASYLGLFVLIQLNTSGGVIYKDWKFIAHSSLKLGSHSTDEAISMGVF